jgi:hypothetical protein
MHVWRASNALVVEFVHHSSSLPSWLYSRPDESNACYECVSVVLLPIICSAYSELVRGDHAKATVGEVSGPAFAEERRTENAGGEDDLAVGVSYDASVVPKALTSLPGGL